IAVIGNGNVALDVARMLVKHPEDLEPTEVPDNVLDGLRSSPVTDVHVFGRRGPMQVKFTPLELRELGELNDVDIILDDADFDLDDGTAELTATNKQLFVINKILTGWREREVGGASRRLHLHFYSKPVEVLGGGGDDSAEGAASVRALRIERTMPHAADGGVGTGEVRAAPVKGVYRAIGKLRT